MIEEKTVAGFAFNSIVRNYLESGNQGVKELSPRHIYILICAKILHRKQAFFSANQVFKMMSSYRHSASMEVIQTSIKNLVATGHLERLNKTRQWFKPYKYSITPEGSYLISEISEMMQDLEV